MSKIRFIGLDVHAGTIAIAIAEPNGEVHSVGVIPNRLESIRKAMAKLGPAKQLKACYEAGPTGYVLYWQLTQLGVSCEVIAPSLVPAKAGDRVKTDRRDAEKLARCYRNGDLTRSGFPMRRMRHCGIWYERGKMPNRTGNERVNGWANFCCGTEGKRRRTLKRSGRRST